MQDMKTVNDMRSILSEEVTKIRAGETTAANINAIVNACGKILQSIKLEMEYSKYVGPAIPFINKLQTGDKKLLSSKV